MICPRCANPKSKVMGTEKSTITERWRKCLACGYKWNTVEVPKNDRYLKGYTYSLFDDEAWQKDNAIDDKEKQDEI